MDMPYDIICQYTCIWIKEENTFQLDLTWCKTSDIDFCTLFFFDKIKFVDSIDNYLDSFINIRIIMYSNNSSKLDYFFRTKCFDRSGNKCHIGQYNLSEIECPDRCISDCYLFNPSKILFICINLDHIAKFKLFGIQNHHSSDHIPQYFFECKSHTK